MRTVLIIIFLWVLFAIVEYCFLKINFHQWWHPNYYNALNLSFNTSKYSPQVTSYISNGQQIAAKKSLVICGLARNIKNRLEFNIPKLETIGKAFKDYRVVIFENDSTDGTRELIKDWSSTNSHVILLECCDLGDCNCQLREKNLYDLGAMTNARINKMAFFRNRYLQYVQKNLNDFDYLLVIDLDLEGSISLDGIFHSLGSDNNKWDMIALNGRSPLPGTFGLVTNAYDALAFRRIKEVKATKNINFLVWFQKWFRMNHLLNQTPNQLISVRSAFNGAALYRISSLKGSKYNTISNSEHIGLHQSMSNLGFNRIYLNPVWKGYVGYQGPRGNLGSFWKSIISN